MSLITICAQSQEQKDWRLYQSETAVKDTLTEKQIVIPTGDSHQLPTGKITYFQDSKIELLDSLRKENPTKLSGYRVQIYFGNRNDARQTRAKFMLEHPKNGAYISYLAPNFRLRVGDFRTRLECESFKKEIAREFPGSYLVKDKIELPILHPETDEEKTID